MGDYYQSVADLDADLKSAQATADRLRDWMISRQIIVATPSDCILSESLGYAPGEQYSLAVKSPSPVLFETHTNGVQFIAEHKVFYTAGDLVLVCSSCGARFEAGDSWDEALGDWYKNYGPGMLPCAQCGVKIPITEWQHDPPWAFGNVGVTFWNWPELRSDFLNDLSGLVGHRFRLVYGKI